MEQILTLSLKGKFYRANEDCAITLHNIMHYKLNHQQNGIVYSGLPENALAKVLIKLDSLHVDYRVYRPLPDDMLHIYAEKHFDDNQYGKYCEMEDEDLAAYDFICRMCDMSDYAAGHKKDLPNGLQLVLDLDDPEIRENLYRVKRKMEEL